MAITFKKYLDTQIGDHGYIQILKWDNTFLFEGKVSELRSDSLWALIDEWSAKVKKTFYSRSKTGRRCITVVLTKPAKKRENVKYIVTCISTELEYTVEAKNSQQAKRIVCRWRNISPSDYWCGLTNYSARKAKDTPNVTTVRQ